MKLKSILVFVICCLIFSGPESAAQDFNKVIAIVDEMENSLKGLIAKEEMQRQTEISDLQKDIQNLQVQMQNTSNSVTTNNQQDFEALTGRVSMLENKVNNLNSSPETNELAGQLNQLITELKKVIDSNKNTPPVVPSIKVGFLAQVHGQTVQEQTTAVQDADPNIAQHWQRQIYVRRLRIILGGDIAKNTTFFFETDAPNLGKVNALGVKDSKISMYVQDAQIQHAFMPELNIIAGLQLVGISRNGLQSAASLLALDYGAYQFTINAPLDNLIGRDFGINLRGHLFDERLEYRTGVFSGRNTNQYSPLRFTSRLHYNFKDKEKGFYYTGTTLGKGEILSLGAGADMQGSYKSFSFDGFNDMPLGDLGSLTMSASISFLDGGGSDQDSTVFTGLIPRQSILFAELGYFLKDLNLQPYFKYESQNINASVLKQVGATESNLDLKNKLRSNQRFGFGINYFLSGHNASIKLLYEVVTRNRTSLDPAVLEHASSGMLTLQLQYFTF
jgi:polyhydroxyalkanoate synthesis regulator phasin